MEYWNTLERNDLRGKHLLFLHVSVIPLPKLLLIASSADGGPLGFLDWIATQDARAGLLTRTGEPLVSFLSRETSIDGGGEGARRGALPKREIRGRGGCV
jgi:hypothetical protein